MRSHCLVVSGRQRLTRRRLERIYRAKHTSDRLIIVSVDAIDLPGPPFFFFQFYPWLRFLPLFLRLRPSLAGDFSSSRPQNGSSGMEERLGEIQSARHQVTLKSEWYLMLPKGTIATLGQTDTHTHTLSLSLSLFLSLPLPPSLPSYSDELAATKESTCSFLSGLLLDIPPPLSHNNNSNKNV